MTVDFDGIARALGAGGHRPTGAIREAAFAARDAAVAVVLDGVDADAWVIHTSPSREQVDQYAAADSEFHLLDPGMDTCLARAAEDGRPDGTEQSIRDWYASPPDVKRTHAQPRRASMEPDGIKSVPFKVKAAGPDDGLTDGQFEGYASVFGNVDSYGDIVVKGAFADTLREWQEKGDPIPLLWGHDFNDPFSNIGAIDSAEEDDHGLKVRGTFDLDNPKAAQVYKLAKGRRTTGMSFAYDVRDAERKDDGNYLKALHIYEASIVPIGANPLAGVEAVKSGAETLLKAGRVLSQKNENALRDARNAIDSVLSSLGTEEDGKAAPAADPHDQEKASGDAAEAKGESGGSVADSGQPDVKSEEPTPTPPVKRLAAQAHIYALMGQEGV